MGNDLLKIRKLNRAKLILKIVYSSAITLAAILKTKICQTSRPWSPSRLPLRAHRRETSGYEAATERLALHHV